MRGSDGRGPATALGAGVAAHFGLATVSDVAIAVHQGRPGEADLITMVPVLFGLVHWGTPLPAADARQAAEVCVMAMTAMRHLGLPAAGTVVVLGGGLLQAGDPLLSREVEARFAVERAGRDPAGSQRPPSRRCRAPRPGLPGPARRARPAPAAVLHLTPAPAART